MMVFFQTLGGGRDIKELISFVKRVASVTRLGGTCHAVDDRRCILYDCSNWTNEMHALVRHRFPTCTISVSTLESSVSGFVVMFELHENVSRLFNSFMASLIALCLVVVSCYIFLSVEHVLPYFPATVAFTETPGNTTTEPAFSPVTEP
jgi:hypothetical protein